MPFNKEFLLLQHLHGGCSHQRNSTPIVNAQNSNFPDQQKSSTYTAIKLHIYVDRHATSEKPHHCNGFNSHHHSKIYTFISVQSTIVSHDKLESITWHHDLIKHTYDAKFRFRILQLQLQLSRSIQQSGWISQLRQTQTHHTVDLNNCTLGAMSSATQLHRHNNGYRLPKLVPTQSIIRITVHWITHLITSRATMTNTIQYWTKYSSTVIVIGAFMVWSISIRSVHRYIRQNWQAMKKKKMLTTRRFHRKVKKTKHHQSKLKNRKCKSANWKPCLTIWIVYCW